MFSLRRLGSVRCWRFGLAFCDAVGKDGGYVVLVWLSLTHTHTITITIITLYYINYPCLHPSLPPPIHPSFNPSPHPSPPNVQSLILPATHTHTHIYILHASPQFRPRPFRSQIYTLLHTLLHTLHSPPFPHSYHLSLIPNLI